MLGTLEEDLKKIEAMENSAEFQMKLQGLRKKMLGLRRLIFIPFIVFMFLHFLFMTGVRDFMISSILLILLPPGFFIVCRMTGMFSGRNKGLQEVYGKELLEPLLRNFYPDLTVETQGIAPEEVKKFTPKSQKYIQDTFLCFHDDRDLRMGNLESFHRTSGKNPMDIFDFVGQLYCMKSPVAIQGEVRIVPTDRSIIFKNEVQIRYPGCRKGEKKLDTEDIEHNERFDIYATDEFGARRFLTPEVLRVFSEKFPGKELSLYIKGELLYIAIYSGQHMFKAPENKEEIKSLSFTEEYKKLRSSLEYIEDICKAFDA